MNTSLLLRSLAGMAFIFASTSMVDISSVQAQDAMNNLEKAKTAPAQGLINIKEQQAKLEMIVNSSQILKLNGDIARANVGNDALLDVRPISRDQMLVSAKATGFTQVDLFKPDGTVHNVQVTVIGDARELASILQTEFPSSTITVRPIQNAVILSGSVSSDVHVAAAVQIAQQYYPNVINRIEVLGVHTVQLHVQIMEVSRTKLRNAGVDWAVSGSNAFIEQTASGLLNPGGPVTGPPVSAGNETFKVNVFNGSDGFFAYLNLLKRDNLVKVLADPTLTAIDGRPASFNSGGEFPVLVPAGLGQVGVEFREFGTRLDFVAKVRGDGMIHLEVRPMISEVDDSRSVQVNGISVPGLRSRYVETAVELRAGQTLALAGLLQMRTEASVQGLPGLSDLPYIGAIFRNVREIQNEVELLITVTPDFAGGMDPSEVPQTFPGFNTTSPSDKELYWRGYIEVPVVPNSENCQPQESVPGQIQISTPSELPPVNEYYPADVSQNFGPLRSDQNRGANNTSARNSRATQSSGNVQQASHTTAVR